MKARAPNRIRQLVSRANYASANRWILPETRIPTQEYPTLDLRAGYPWNRIPLRGFDYFAAFAVSSAAFAAAFASAAGEGVVILVHSSAECRYA